MVTPIYNGFMGFMGKVFFSLVDTIIVQAFLTDSGPQLHIHYKEAASGTLL